MKYDGDYLLDDFGRIVMQAYWESPIMKQRWSKKLFVRTVVEY